MKQLRYWLDFVSMPLIIAALAYLSPASMLSPLLFVAGFIAWTFAEYYIHRVVFHRMYRREHWAHHLRPTDQSGAVSALQSHYVLALVLFFARLLAGPWANPFTAGVTLGYLLYIVVHHAIHHGWISGFGVFGSVVRRHDWHHAGHEENFNFIFPIGDLIFGTYRKV